jgi:hypothetical protein
MIDLAKKVENYEQFKEKWAGRTTYEHGGLIELHQNETVFVSYSLVDADVFFTPSIIGWESEAQRRVFYKDCKKIGLRRVPKKKNEWYKRIY